MAERKATTRKKLDYPEVTRGSRLAAKARKQASQHSSEERRRPGTRVVFYNPGRASPELVTLCCLRHRYQKPQKGLFPRRRGGAHGGTSHRILNSGALAPSVAFAGLPNLREVRMRPCHPYSDRPRGTHS